MKGGAFFTPTPQPSGHGQSRGNVRRADVTGCETRRFGYFIEFDKYASAIIVGTELAGQVKRGLETDVPFTDWRVLYSTDDAGAVTLLSIDTRGKRTKGEGE